jgi:hypothetical protein
MIGPSRPERLSWGFTTVLPEWWLRELCRPGGTRAGRAARLMLWPMAAQAKQAPFL